MSELEKIIRAAQQAVAAGQAPVMATVVNTAGSSYRLPGARMLVTEEGWQAGSISGGCLEGDIVRRGAWLAAGGPVVVSYDTTDDEDIVHGLGLGCRGMIQVLVERLDTPQGEALLAELEQLLRSRRPAVVAVIIETDGGGASGARLLFDADGRIAYACASGHPAEHVAAIEKLARQVLQEKRSATATVGAVQGAFGVFLEYLAPAPELFLFGAGHDAMPLAAFGKAMGFRVTVLDGRPAYAKAARFPHADRVRLAMPGSLPQDLSMHQDAAAVVMTHHYLSDRKILRMLLATQAGYIGLLGPKKRARELLDDLAADGAELEAADLRRLFAPAGLDLGAHNPEQVALAILAEIHAVRSGRAGGMLREREGPIHADALRRFAVDLAPALEGSA